MGLNGLSFFFVVLFIFVTIGEIVLIIYDAKKHKFPDYKPNFWDVAGWVCLFSNFVFICISIIDLSDVININRQIRLANDIIQVFIFIVLLMVYVGTPIVLIRDFIAKVRKSDSARNNVNLTWFLLVEFVLSLSSVYLLISTT